MNKCKDCYYEDNCNVYGTNEEDDYSCEYYYPLSEDDLIAEAEYNISLRLRQEMYLSLVDEQQN